MKTWTDVFFAAVRRGDDPFRAMDIADAWKKRMTPRDTAWRLSRGVISKEIVKDSIPQEGKMSTYTYYAVVRNGVTIYEGMGKQEAKAYAREYGGTVVTKKAKTTTIDDIAAALEIPVEQLEREMRGE